MARKMEKNGRETLKKLKDVRKNSRMPTMEDLRDAQHALEKRAKFFDARENQITEAHAFIEQWNTRVASIQRGTKTIQEFYAEVKSEIESLNKEVQGHIQTYNLNARVGGHGDTQMSIWKAELDQLYEKLTDKVGTFICKSEVEPWCARNLLHFKIEDPLPPPVWKNVGGSARGFLRATALGAATHVQRIL